MKNTFLTNLNIFILHYVIFLKNEKLMTNIYKNVYWFRDILYKRNNHVSDITLTKHTFDSISKDFFKLKNKTHKPQVKIYFIRCIPFENDCAILNCVNAAKPNSGYKIDNSKTQEGQLFIDSDMYAADIYGDGECLYPFDFKKEIIICKKCNFP